MTNPKEILVITTSSVDGLSIKQYLKPVSAHIVAGTNFFSDFFASFSDFFGGRSGTYQSQLTSLYNEAIERIRYAAFELGANCVIGLKIDLDEISGKGKSMFMLTAIGTAVIIDKKLNEKVDLYATSEKLENVSVDKINFLWKKRKIIERANKGDLQLNDEVWNFITQYQIEEVYPYLLKKYAEEIAFDISNPGHSDNFHRYLIVYLDALPENIKVELLYSSIRNEGNEQYKLKLAAIIKDLHLYDFHKCIELLKSESFLLQKIGLRIATYDKPFYNRQDIVDLGSLSDVIKSTFVERGVRVLKKQFLSTTEKEVWNCECGGTSNSEIYCGNCGNNIYGFGPREAKPLDVDNYINDKIDLILEFISE